MTTTDLLRQTAIDDYKKLFAAGDERIFTKWFDNDDYSNPKNIVGTHIWDNDGTTTIDICFENQDHVAVYSVKDGELVFEGFES